MVVEGRLAFDAEDVTFPGAETRHPCITISPCLEPHTAEVCADVPMVSCVEGF